MAWVGAMSVHRWFSFVVCIAVGTTGFELEFQAEPSSRLAKYSDGRASFRCETTPDSAEIRWLWNGLPVVPNRYLKVTKEKLIVHFGKTDKNSRFPYNADNGYFQCEGRFRGKALVSAPAELIVAVLEPFPPQEDIHLTFLKGNTAVIPCQPPYSVPTVVTEFLFKNETITRSIGRKLLMPSGGLQIVEADASDSGEYICVAYNPYVSERKQASHKVILYVIDQSKHIPLRFVASPPAKKSIVLGTNITLECAAEGFPIPSIMWRREHGNLPSLRHHQIAGNLLLISVRRADEGTYICEAENSSGSHVTTSTIIEVHESPQITKRPYDGFLEGGENMTLSCASRGHPKPVITWMHNGKFVSAESTERTRESYLFLKNVTRKDMGVYQCFARNELGTAYASSELIMVSNSSEEDYGSEDEDYEYDQFSNLGLSAGHRKDSHLSSNNHHPKHHNNPNNTPSHMNEADLTEKHHRKKKKHKGVKLIPPSKPEITRLTDTSVMVRWNVPRNDGLPILFFKVQYREMGRRSHDWMTVDEDIAAHIHSYAVTDLRNGGKYRFRIAAVYSNNDNKLGPNSAKFILHKDSPTRKPLSGPVITHAEAVSPSAITLHWEYEDVDSDLVEGFFLYYRTTHSAGEYLKVTVLGANTRSHIISHLLPSTGYDIKMQCFNLAGTSDFSNIYTSKTQPSKIVDSNGHNIDTNHVNEEIAAVSVTEPVSSKDSDKKLILDIVLGVVSAAMLIALVAFGVVYVKQRINRSTNRRNQIPASKASNGHGTTNGYLPVDKINISINPLSELDSDSADKPDENEDVVSNNNEIIHMQTFSTNENNPQLDPLLAQEAQESVVGEEAAEETVILPSNTEQDAEGPRSI